jgi:hypothetical protein
MGPRYLKDGQDFSFDTGFGFTGSAQGRHDARDHPQVDDGEYGDGSYVEKEARGGKVGHFAKGGKVKGYDVGGPVMGGTPGAPMVPPQPMMAGQSAPMAPMGPPQMGALMQNRAALPGSFQRNQISAPGQQAIPAMAKGGKFIGAAIKHPGRMKKLAKEHGRSTHDEMEHDKHSSDPSLRSAANLGLRLTGGDLSPKRRKK